MSPQNGMSFSECSILEAKNVIHLKLETLLSKRYMVELMTSNEQTFKNKAF